MNILKIHIDINHFIQNQFIYIYINIFNSYFVYRSYHSVIALETHGTHGTPVFFTTWWGWLIASVPGFQAPRITIAVIHRDCYP